MLTLSLAFLSSSGLAQSTVLGTDILPATAAYPNGFGSPTVWYTGTGYRMHADTLLSAGSVPVGCAVAYSIVRSDSVDGVVWSAPVLVQGPSLRTPCGARQPGGVLLDNGRWAVAFQDVNSGSVGIRGNIWGGVSTVLTSIVGEEPSLVRYGSAGAGGAFREWSLFAQNEISSDVEEWNTLGNAGNWSTWVFRGTLLIPGALTFAADGAYSPTFACVDGSSTWPFTTAFGGEAGSDAGWIYGVVRDNRNLSTTATGAVDVWPVGNAAQWLSFDTIDDLTDVGVWYEAPAGQINVAVVGGGVLPGSVAGGRDCRP